MLWFMDAAMVCTSSTEIQKHKGLENKGYGV